MSYFDRTLSIFKVELNYLDHDINQIVYGNIVFLKLWKSIQALILI